MTAPVRPRRPAAGSATGHLPRRPMAASVAIVVIAALALLAGCSNPTQVSQVTVSAGSVTVTLPVALSCAAPTGATAFTCAGGADDTGAPHLKLPPGTPVDVTVPQGVGDTPWVIVFSYRDKDGAAQGDRTSVFPAGQRFSYHLQPPAGAQLTRLEVQSLTAALASNGGLEFPAARSWVLVVDPATGTG